MKIRNGFVSNSSSSSFIVKGSAYENVFELAALMVSIREWDEDAELIDKINKSSLDKNTPISFRTCNYDTYICKDDKGNYNVQTCNNHAWPSTVNGIDRTLESVYQEKDYEPYDNIRIGEMMTFWYPEIDIMGCESSKYHWCQYHHSNFLYINDITMDECPECYKEYKNAQQIELSAAKRCKCGNWMVSLLSEWQLSPKGFPSEIMWCNSCGTIKEIFIYYASENTLELFQKGSMAKVLREWKTSNGI